MKNGYGIRFKTSRFATGRIHGNLVKSKTI